MLMVKSIVCIFFLLLNLSGFAQNNENRFDNFYVEGGGAGLVYSLNFERAVPDSRQAGKIYSAGLTFLPFKGLTADFGLLGSVCGYYNKSPKSQFIYGLGSTLFFGEEFKVVLNLSLSYKYTFPNNRMYAGATLYGLCFLPDAEFLPWPGLRVGYNFNMKCKYCKA